MEKGIFAYSRWNNFTIQNSVLCLLSVKTDRQTVSARALCQPAPLCVIVYCFLFVYKCRQEPSVSVLSIWLLGISKLFTFP